MPEQAPHSISQEGEVRERPRQRQFNKADLDHFAEYVWSEYLRRKDDPKRKQVELQWKEVDRQVELCPDDSHKRDAEGKLHPHRHWMPEHEEPGQSQTLERSQKDARNLMFPRVGPYFMARGSTNEEYERRLQAKLDQQPIGGSQVTAEVINRITMAWHMEIQRRYPFRASWDHLNGEAIKYGLFAGRMRAVKNQMMVPTSKGLVPQNSTYPALIPRSIKSTYPDDRTYNIMHEGYELGGAVIAYARQRLADLQIAASKGRTDPNLDDGGWMAGALRGVQADEKDGCVDVVEYEGDLIVPRKTVGSVWLPGVIVSVLNNGADAPKIFRLRWRHEHQSTWIIHPYHKQDIENPYATGLLMKGAPIQAAASKGMVLGLSSGHLNVLPPVKSDRDDAYFEAQGGPIIEPSRVWRTTSDVDPVEIGDPQTLFNTYLQLVNQYKELTGQLGPRAGAQTLSHTTLGAKQAELARGAVPVTGYIETVLEDPMMRFLNLEMAMSKRIMTGAMDVYVPDWGWMQIDRSMLPERVHYEVFGSAGPLEEQQQKQDRAAALQLAVQLDALREQLQRPGRPLDINAIQRKLIQDAGEPEPEQFFESGNQQLLEGVAGRSPVPTGVGQSGAPAARLVGA